MAVVREELRAKNVVESVVRILFCTHGPSGSATQHHDGLKIIVVAGAWNVRSLSPRGGLFRLKTLAHAEARPRERRPTDLSLSTSFHTARELARVDPFPCRPLPLCIDARTDSRLRLQARLPEWMQQDGHQTSAQTQTDAP